MSEVAGAGGAGSEAGAAGLGAGGADIGSGAPVNAAGAGAGMSCTPVPDGPERDADGDGLIDVFDTDDDNDGISDLDECFPSAGRFINPGFEEPLVASSTPPDFDYYNVSLVPGWSNDTGTMEIWESGFQGIAAAVGLQFMELSARALDSLRQDVATVPGSTLRWGFYHRNRANEDDELELLIGAPAGLESQGHFTTGSAWILYEGTYSVPAGQTTTRFELVHVVPDYAAGNLVDHFDVEPICSVDTDADGCVDSEDPD